MDEELNRILDLVKKHNIWRKVECINLIASENITSPLVDVVYLSDAMHRYAEGLPYKRFYQGTKYIDEIEVLASSLFASLLEAKYADLRPLSGTLANASTFAALAEFGDAAAIFPLPGGGHVSHSEYGILGKLGIKPYPLPIIEEEMNIDIDKAIKLIRLIKPKFVTLGATVILFPHPVKELSLVTREVDAKLIFDAAHVLGLIMGGVYPNPLKEGADILTTSTHKTFPGPQGGAIATNDEGLFKKVRRIVFPVFVSNHHLHRLAAIAVTALEMKYFGKRYAEQIIKNAKKLAEELYNGGFKVLCADKGFTQTHQVVVDVREEGGGKKCAEVLEEANIIVNKNMLSWDKPSDVHNPSGIRIGVQEVTRLGMKEEDMVEIARFIYRLLKRKEDPVTVRKDVIEFRKSFTKVHYTFEVDIKKTFNELYFSLI